MKVTKRPVVSTLSPLLAFLLALVSSPIDVVDGAVGEDGICRAVCSSSTGNEVCRFTAKVDLHAGELGYYQFEECNGAINPTLGMEIRKRYEFVQADRSNYYHPLGFAYFPDGAHADADELEPGVVPPGSKSKCNETLACPAPMYFQDGQYLGTYSNDASIANVTKGEDNFGLDDYEPKFFHPIPEWAGYGMFSVSLTFDADTDFTQDIFYFCHIHEFMSGRIKLLRDDVPIQPNIDLPELGYTYDEPSRYDKQCGTYGLESYQLPNAECPSKFVCNVPTDNEQLAKFSNCLDSMNCAMMAGMTTNVESEVSLFIHQMIPHHQNAVNMAKALLKSNVLACDDLAAEEETDDCVMEGILREIVNGQNKQIQAMRAVLNSMGYPPEDDCKVEIGNGGNSTTSSSDEGGDVKSSSAGVALRGINEGRVAVVFSAALVGVLSFSTFGLGL